MTVQDFINYVTKHLSEEELKEYTIYIDRILSNEIANEYVQEDDFYLQIIEPIKAVYLTNIP